MSIRNLLERAAIIRDASQTAENTAWRVGGLLVNLINEIDKTAPKIAIDATSIGISQKENSIEISFKTIDINGLSGVKKITIPAVNNRAAGAMTPTDRTNINSALANAQSALDAVRRSEASAQSANDLAARAAADALEALQYAQSVNTGASAQEVAAAIQAALDSRKDFPGGYASIGLNGQLSYDKLPDSVKRSAVRFGGFIVAAADTASLTLYKLSTDADVSVKYNIATNKFLIHNTGMLGLGEQPTYYPSWRDADVFGEAGVGGVSPQEGKLYIDVTDDNIYYFNGTKMLPVGFPTLDVEDMDYVNIRELLYDYGKVCHITQNGQHRGLLMSAVCLDGTSVQQTFISNCIFDESGHIQGHDDNKFFVYFRTGQIGSVVPTSANTLFNVTWQPWTIIGGSQIAQQAAQTEAQQTALAQQTQFRNLLKKSYLDPGDSNIYNPGHFQRWYYPSEPIVNDEVYSALVDVTTTQDNTEVILDPYGYEYQRSVLVPTAGRHVLVFRNMLYHNDNYPPSGGYSIVTTNKDPQNCTIHSVMLVKGDVPLTAWTPAPEDLYDLLRANEPTTTN